jgi:hypothetical protein
MRRTAAPSLLSLVVVLLLGCSQGHHTSPSGPSAPGGSALVTLVNVDTSVNVTAGYTATWNWLGQSVTTPVGSGFNNIRFHWYTRDDQPAAFGTLHILDREYLGLPGDLGGNTPGFVARSERIVDNAYVFPGSVTLKGGTKYWFYGDTQGSFVGSFDVDTYPAGDLYVTGYPAYPFHKVGASGRMVNGTYVPPPPVCGWMRISACRAAGSNGRVVVIITDNAPTAQPGSSRRHHLRSRLTRLRLDRPPGLRR